MSDCFLIQHPNAADTPPDSSVDPSVKRGYFVNATSCDSGDGTAPNAEWFNMVTQNLCSLAAATTVMDEPCNDVLLRSIRLFIRERLPVELKLFPEATQEQINAAGEFLKCVDGEWVIVPGAGLGGNVQQTTDWLCQDPAAIQTGDKRWEAPAGQDLVFSYASTNYGGGGGCGFSGTLTPGAFYSLPAGSVLTISEGFNGTQGPCGPQTGVTAVEIDGTPISSFNITSTAGDIAPFSSCTPFTGGTCRECDDGNDHQGYEFKVWFWRVA